MPDELTPLPVHLRNHDAEYIEKFAERMKTFWSNQDKLDQAFEDMDNMKQVIDVASDKKDSKAKTLKMGILGRQNKKNASILHVLPFSRFNPASTNPKDIKHANKLEAFIVGAAKKSMKTGDSQTTIPGKGIRTGRAWEMTIADPSVWSGPSFKDQADKIKNAPDGSKAEAEEKLKMMKRDQWPIQVSEVSSRSTWTYFSGKTWLPEIVQILKMSAEAIVSEWGEDALPSKSIFPWNNQTDFDVLIYTNHKWIKTVIGSKAPKIVHFFEHDMGMNPVQLGEFVRAPENDLNIRWQPDAYHTREIAEAIDESLSDWRTAQREATRARVVMYFDKEEYDQDAMVNGRPAVIDLTPGGPMIAAWLGEKIERIPGAVMNEQASFYTSMLLSMADSEIKRPAREGEFKSGTSGTTGLIQNQLSERDLNPAMTALKALWEAKTKLIMRAVVRVNRDFPSRVDKISVYDPRVTGKGFIDIGPDDVIGMEAGILVLADKAIPTDRNLELAQAQREKDIGADAELYMGVTLGYENVPAVKQRRFRDDLEIAVNQVLVALTVNRTIVQQQTLSAEEQSELVGLRANASPEFLSATQGTTQGQSNANILGGGVPERPQGLGR